MTGDDQPMSSTTLAELVRTDAQRASETVDDRQRAEANAVAGSAPAKQESGNYDLADQGRAIEVEDLNSANDGGAA